MKRKAGSTSVWFVVLLASALCVALSFHDQVASAWHKTMIAAYMADKPGGSEGCPALLSSANPDDVQYCIKRSAARAHAEGWTELGYLAALVLGAPVIVLGFFAAARWIGTIVRRMPPHSTAHDRRA